MYLKSFVYYIQTELIVFLLQFCVVHTCILSVLYNIMCFINFVMLRKHMFE